MTGIDREWECPVSRLGDCAEEETGHVPCESVQECAAAFDQASYVHKVRVDGEEIEVRSSSPNNPGILAGVYQERVEETFEPTPDEEGSASLVLASLVLTAHPEDRERAKIELRESLMALGLIPDPLALGCNMNDERFVSGSRKLRVSVQKARGGDSS